MEDTTVTGTKVDYWPTYNLRYVMKNVPLKDALGAWITTEKVLQQLWFGSDGSRKWEDIETVTEDK